MKNTRKTIIATAAITGLLGGVALNQARSAGTNAPAAGKQAAATVTPKVHGCGGDNDCKGTGGCKTDAHTCKFLNSCKGKGGCEITDKDIKKWEQLQKAAKDKTTGSSKAAKSN